MESLLHRNSRRPDVSFYRDGRIDITARVARLLGIRPGDVIDIAHEGGEFYMFVSHKADDAQGRHEGQCYPTKHRSHNFRTHSKRLCQAIMALSNATNVARLPIGDTALLFDKTVTAVILIVRNNLSNT